jgi:hypothetical protein
MIVTDDDQISLPALLSSARFERTAERLLELVEDSCDPNAGFAENTRAALRAALVFFAADPDAASLLTVEPYAADSEAARRWRERFGELLRSAANGGSSASPYPAFLEPALIGGITWQISRWVLAERTEQLEQQLPALLESILVFYMDTGQAV